MAIALNPRQHEAVRHISGPLLVLAGAGSGKTRVITEKIAYLIHDCGYKPRNIIAVTFTNKAAREMKERVAKLMEGREARGLGVSTFHTLGLNMIKSDLAGFGMKAGFSIFDDEDCRTLIKELLNRERSVTTEEMDRLRWQISEWKNALLSPDEAAASAENDKAHFSALVYREYTHHLRVYNAVDFDDLIALPTWQLRENAEFRRKWQERVHYLLVDECQDTNTAQYELVKLLVGQRQQFTVVGDDDQSIYAWRGARPENLAQLAEDYPTLKVVKLEQNYRSVGRILKAANAVIANNSHVFEKKLWSEMGFGDPIRVLRLPDEELEAERIAAEIMNRRLRDSLRWGDFAVLYRGNHQSRAMEMKLQALNIPYRVSGGTSFFSRAEIRDVMSYIRLIINPDDDNALLRVINTPRREIGASTIEKLAGYARNRNISLFSACDEVGPDILDRRALENVRQFYSWMMHTAREVVEGNAAIALRQMLTDMQYQDWLMEQSATPKAAERRYENVEQLLGSISRMQEKAVVEGDEEAEGVESILGRLILRDMLEQQEQEEENPDRVQLLTLHAAKGLEFPNVYMMGVEEDLLPHRNSIEGETIEEERRLMYVGITRARFSLTLTMAAERKSQGGRRPTTPSRFLDEIPPEDLQWENREQQRSQQDSDAIRDAHLAHLKGFLKNL